jgi:hypothetical protein
MIKLGIIGMNEGNGHPYSYSAIFNGFDESALMKECPFQMIKQYLPKEHQNRVFIEDVKITHVWTQERKISESIARVARIPNIVNNMEDLIGKVDGIILARDDVENHFKMARPFIKAKLPLYIDKLLAPNMEELNELLTLAGKDYPLMACSSSRYHKLVEKAKKELDVSTVRTVHGTSRCAWIRYASHLLDGICHIFGTDVEYVQNVGRKGADTVFIHYRNNLDVVLQVMEDLALPIRFTCYSNKNAPHSVDFTDGPDYTEYFYSFVNMMKAFTGLVRTRIQPIPLDEIVKIATIIIAGETSREQDGRKIYIGQGEKYAYKRIV